MFLEVTRTAHLDAKPGCEQVMATILHNAVREGVSACEQGYCVQYPGALTEGSEHGYEHVSHRFVVSKQCVQCRSVCGHQQSLRGPDRGFNVYTWLIGAVRQGIGVQRHQHCWVGIHDRILNR